MMMYNFEAIVENVENKKARLIIIEKNEKGWRSVRDIYEGDIEWAMSRTANFFGDVIALIGEEVKILNENINFGRAKRPAAQMKKVIEALVAGERFN